LAKYKDILHNKSFELIRIKDQHKKEFFKEHRHNYYELIFITQGNGHHSIDFHKYELKENVVYIVKPTQVHQWLLEEFHNEYDGYIFLFSKDLFHDDDIINNLFNTNVESVINICNDTKNKLMQLIEMINEEYFNDDDSLLISHLFGAFLKYIIKSKKSIESQSNIDKRIEILQSFIEKHYKEEKSANFYAQKFDITTKRLNEITQLNINKTVSELINSKVIIEGKRELIYSNLTIKKISDELGFSDPSHFSRFFKKHTSFSPLQFKEDNTK